MSYSHGRRRTRQPLNTTVWVGQPPKITRQQYQVIRRVMAARDAVPTNFELAKQFGVKEKYIKSVIQRGIARYDREIEQEGEP